MNKILKKAALPCMAMAALAFAAPAAHADTTVQFATELLWGTGTGTVSNAASPPPATALPQLINPSSIADGEVSTITVGTTVVTYNGEQNLTSVDSLGDLTGTSFGNFTDSNVTPGTALSQKFTLDIYQYVPTASGHLVFAGDVTGTLAASSGTFLITWDPGAKATKYLSNIGYSLESYQTEGITPNFPNLDEILGDVAAAPLPKSASISMALFGILAAFGFAKRKSLTLT